MSDSNRIQTLWNSLAYSNNLPLWRALEEDDRDLVGYLIDELFGVIDDLKEDYND